MPTGDTQTWLHRARALGPMIDAAAAADEAASELAKPVVEAIDAAGIFAMLAPQELGGAEAHPLEAVDAISELSYWDGSAGWYSHAVITGGAVAGAFLGPRAVAAIFPNQHFARAAGQAAPTGTAVRDGDHYRISGRFSFGSGTADAAYLVGGYMLQDSEEPVMLIGLAPRDQVRFHGNWQVLGLRGTGSYDFEVTEQLVHRDFCFNAAAPVQQRGGALYQMGFMAIPCLSHASFALGASRRLLDEWRGFARTKPRGAGMASDLGTFQRDFAAATADWHAADAYVRQTFAALYDAAESGGMTADLQLQGQLCTSHAFTMANRLVQAALPSCTTRLLRGGNALQRAVRDILAGSAHVLNAEQALIDAGKVLAGIDGAATPLTREGYSLGDGIR